MKSDHTVNDRPPNFRSEDGRLYLVRCFSCGAENYAPAVSSGRCAFCGWKAAEEEADGEG